MIPLKKRMNTTMRRITMDSDKKHRWFWDSSFAEKMEGWLFQMAWWWTDKRFPVSTKTMDDWPTNEFPVANTAPTTEQVNPPWESWKSSDFTVVEEPKKKKAAKTATKKKKTTKRA